MAHFKYDHGQYYVIFRDPEPDPEYDNKRRLIWHPCGKNLRAARKERNRIEEMLENGISPRMQLMTVGEAWRKRALAAVWSGTTRRDYESMFERYIDPYWADLPVKRVDGPRVTEFIIYLRAQGVGDGRLRNIEIAFRALLNWCYKLNYTHIKPEKAWFPLPPNPGRDVVALTYEQVEALADAAGDRGRHFILWQALAGTRLGEARALRWEDFNADFTEVRVRRKWEAGILKPYTKTKDRRTTPIMPRLREAMLELHQSHGTPAKGWVFTHRGECIDGDVFRSAVFNPAAQSVGLEEYRIHDLRSTCCCLMHDAGGTPRRIMKWLGWKRLDTLLGYLRANDDDDDIRDKMQERWDAQLAATTQAAASEPKLPVAQDRAS